MPNKTMQIKSCILIILLLSFSFIFVSARPIFDNMNISNSTASYTYNDTLGGLIGWWKLNIDNQTQYDSSGNQMNGSVANATYTLDEEAPNGAGYIVDTNRSINLTSFKPNETEGTIMVWVKFAEVRAGSIFYVGEVGGNGFGDENSLELATDLEGRINLFFGNGTGHTNKYRIKYPVSSKYLINKWYHIAGTYKNNDYARLYIDGVKVVENDSDMVIDTTWDLPSFIGRAYAGDNQSFINGTVSDVRVYNRSLSDTEIKNIYYVRKPHFSNNETVRINISLSSPAPTTLFYQWFIDGVELLSGLAENFFTYNITIDQQKIKVIVNDSSNFTITHTWDVYSDIEPPIMPLNITFDTSLPAGTNVQGAHNVTGKVGNGYEFNGTNDYTVFTNVSYSVKNLTLMAWVKPYDIRKGHIIYMSNNQIADGWGPYSEIHLSTLNDSDSDGEYAGFSFYLSDDNDTNIKLDGGKYLPNYWYRVVATFQNGIQANLYVNGVKVNSNYSLANSRLDINHWTRNITLGTSNNKSIQYYFNGSLDNIILYNKFLTEQEVYEDYMSFISCTDNDSDGFNITIAPNCGPIDCADEDASINPNSPTKAFVFNIESQGYYLIKANASVTKNYTYSCLKIDDSDIRKVYLPDDGIYNYNVHDRPYLGAGTHIAYFYYDPAKMDVSDIKTSFMNFSDSTISDSYEVAFQTFILNMTNQRNNLNTIMTSRYVMDYYVPFLEFNDSRYNDTIMNQTLDFLDDSYMRGYISSYYGFLKSTPNDTTLSDSHVGRLLWINYPSIYRFHSDKLSQHQIEILRRIYDVQSYKCDVDIPEDVGYENRYIMGAWCLISTGEDMLELETDENKKFYWLNLTQVGYRRVDELYNQIYNSTAIKGIEEYNSPTYTYTQISFLEHIYTFTRNYTIKEEAKKLLDYEYLTVAGNWLNSSLKLASSNSRHNYWYDERSNIYSTMKAKGWVPLEKHPATSYYVLQNLQDSWVTDYSLHKLYNSLANNYYPRYIKQSWGVNISNYAINYITKNFSIGHSGAVFLNPADVSANTGEITCTYVAIHTGNKDNPTDLVTVRMNNEEDPIRDVGTLYPFTVTSQNYTEVLSLQSSWYGRYAVLPLNYTRYFTHVTFPTNLTDFYLGNTAYNVSKNTIEEGNLGNYTLVLNATLNQSVVFRQGNTVVGVKVLGADTIAGQSLKLRVIRDANEDSTTSNINKLMRLTIFHVNSTTNQLIDIGTIYSAIFFKVGLITDETCDYCYTNVTNFRTAFNNIGVSFVNTTRNNVTARAGSLVVSANVSGVKSYNAPITRTFLFEVNGRELGKQVFNSTGLFGDIDCFVVADCPNENYLCQDFKCIIDPNLPNPGGTGTEARVGPTSIIEKVKQMLEEYIPDWFWQNLILISTILFLMFIVLKQRKEKK